MLYAMAIGQLRSYFGFDDATAGFLGTVTLVMSGVGGLIFGWVADRFGRTRALMGTILIFSLASLGAATSQSVLQLLFWRALLGIGMGGEWASGAVLVERDLARAPRNKAISIMQSGWAIGYIMAAVLAALILGRRRSGHEAWRWLFVVGVLPALFTLWVRRNVREPESWNARAATPKARAESVQGHLRARPAVRTLLDRAARRRRAVRVLGLFFWLPPFLARPVEQGGAGMGVVGSLRWIIPMQIGAYFGYLTFGFIADRFGRRRTFMLFMIAAAMLVPIYGQIAASNPLGAARARARARLLRPRLLQHVRRLRRRALPDCSARDRTGHELQLRDACSGALAPYTIGVLADVARRRHRPRARRRRRRSSCSRPC